MTDFELTPEEEGMLAGREGPAIRWALEMQIETAKFFGAERLIPVSSAHMMGDMEVMGDPGLALLKDLAEERQARFRIPMTTNARCVDFGAAERLFQNPAMVAKEKVLIGHLKTIGALQTDTCINYQTLYQPHYGEHVAWGDTGTVIYANSVLGARSNYESGPAAFAAGLTGRTGDYGFHRPEKRVGTVLAKVETELEDLADWGALGAVIGRSFNDYWQVPVIDGIPTAPTSDRLKHLGASLASYGSLAMYHMTGVTPEAGSLAQAFGDGQPTQTITVDSAAIEAVYQSYPADREEIDLVVLTGPQLSLFELRLVAELLDGRKVNGNTQLIITTNRQNYEAAKALDLIDPIESAGGLVLVGVCFYLMAPGDMRETFGWRNVLTNSAKLANIIGGYRYHPIFRRTATCIESAVSGRLAE